MPFCRECGTELKPEARFCPNCGAATGTTGATQSPTPATPAAEDGGITQPEYAGLGRRFFAHLLDAIVILVVYIVVGSSIAAQTGGMTESGFEMQGGPALLAMAVTFLVALFYFAILESTRSGKTFGKMLLGIRVADADGGKAGFGQALMRNLLRLVDGMVLYLVGVIFVLTSQRRQRLGDRIAHTVVLRGHAPTKPDDGRGKKSHVRFSMGVGGKDFVDM